MHEKAKRIRKNAQRYIRICISKACYFTTTGEPESKFISANLFCKGI